MNFPRLLSLSLFALIATHVVSAATDDAAQRQLREDRARFQREIDRQTTDAKIRDDQARQAADQQRTADELARLRAQQDRQSSELRVLNETTRTRTTSSTPSPRLSDDPSPSVSVTPIPAIATTTITPDFSVTVLPNGNCVIYVKGRAAEVLSATDAEKRFSDFLHTRQATVPPQ